MTTFSRRDFLKIGSAVSGAWAVQQMVPTLPESSARPSILIFVFDALSARDMSLHGYHRKTTPNIERFAARATVYNQHYSAAHFTTPGVASLLTGLYPWTHRAINFSGLVARKRTGENLFRALGKQYHRMAYSQNLWANYILAQCRSDLETLLPPDSFSVASASVGGRLGRDIQESQRAFDEFLFENRTPPPSLLFGLMERILAHDRAAGAPAGDYPLGLPHSPNWPIYFTLKDVFDGLIGVVQGLPASSVAYLHTWSPHEPYSPAKPFYRLFANGWNPPAKPEHKLGARIPQKSLDTRRQRYDEYVANVDFEFGRLLDMLEASGVLQNAYVIVTSDHGDLNERGTHGHSSPLMFDPVLQVPLIISAPGQTSRRDINLPTSSIDLLPTLAHLAGGAVPAWCEGQVLAGLGGPQDPERSIYMMDAARNSAFRPLLNRAAFALRKGAYKLVCYRGFREYGRKDTFELYDMLNDPDELNNRYSDGDPLSAELRAELLARLDSENEKF